MQVVGTIVGGELILLSVQLELTLGDAVAETTDEGGEERLRRVDHIVDVVVALNDIGHFPVLVGHHDGNDGASVVGD